MPTDDPEDDGVRIERQQAFLDRMGVAGINFQAGVVGPALAPAMAVGRRDPGNRRWRPYGARNIGGRVRAIAQDPLDARVMYIGAASGGLHRTTDGGDTWAAVGGPDEVFSIGAVAVSPSNNQVITVGTGEWVSLAVVNPAGVGIRRSVDGGAHWDRLSNAASGGAAGDCDRVGAIAVDPQHEHRFWAATDQGVFRWEPTSHTTPVRGVPAGAFQREPIANVAAPVAGHLAGFSDVIAFGDPDETPGAGGTHRFLILLAGRNDGTIHRARFDRVNATTPLVWSAIATGLPASAERMQLAFCRSNPKFVYGVSTTSLGWANNPPTNLLASTDAGQSFSLRSTTEPGGKQGWYTLCLACHPTDPNLVVMGALEVWRSFDGGVTPFEKILRWPFHNDGVDDAQHADEHVLFFDLQDRNRLWLGNDGGLSVARDITADASAAKFWRKRSHGLQLAQFNDVTVHPVMTYMAGGGLQDNGTFAGVGGGTWLHVDKGDGGIMAYEPTTARQINGNATEGNPAQITVGDPATTAPPPADTLINKAAEVTASPRIALTINRPGVPAGFACPFVGMVVQIGAGQALVATKQGRALLWNTTTNTFAPLGAGPTAAFPGPPPGPEISALEVAPSAPATDWWFGNNRGDVWKTQNGAAGPFPSQNAALILAGHAPSAINTITRIAIHPANNNYVVVATGGFQGHVFLTVNGGGAWFEITGLGGAEPLPAVPVNALAFDPTRTAAQTQTLYAGTGVGVWKLVGLPAANPVGALPVAPAPMLWKTFGNFNDPAPGCDGKLPLLVIADLVAVTHVATPGAAPASYEAGPRHKLIAATFGRGLFECDLGDPADAAKVPRHRLFIRQHVIEDGLHYPRPSIATLNTLTTPPASLFDLGGDPRFPASPTPPAAAAAGGVRFQDANAYDIRIDNRTALFQFFEDVVDGVEFDEELGVEDLLPAESNAIYVQVHNRGTQTITDAEVLLFYADTAGTPPLPPVPDLPADFWPRFRLPLANPNGAMPAAAAPIAAGAADWKRIGRRTGLTVPPGDPLVVRFDFVPPATLAERNVALLALTLSAGSDVLGAAPAPATVIGDLITQERRAALRRTPVARLTRRVYVRDGVDDAADLGAAVAYGARSPDIVVRQAEVADPAATLVDRLDRHPGDLVSGRRDNFIYVRVFNPTGEPVRVQVQLWAAKASNPDAQPSDQANWTTVPPRNPPGGPPPPPGTPVPDTIDVPARGVAYARFVLRNAEDPTPVGALAPTDPYRAYFLAALIAAERTMLPGASPAVVLFEAPTPDRSAVRDAGSFLRFFRTLASSRRAAMRVVRFDLDPAP